MVLMYNNGMKRVGIIISILLTFLLTQPVGAANTQNFYFEDFTGDYYLSKRDDGVSHLRVKEKLTAIFPDYDQNKGICRMIPFTNQGGANVTLPDLSKDDVKLTRNGKAEPIYSIEKTGDEDKNEGYYTVCTGTEEYVRGKQVYELEYNFEKVVTEFEKDGKKYQELYWDANGNGWQQRFNKVTARLHFEDENVYDGQSWCYVGKYGSNNQTRCKTSELGDGLEFSTGQLGVTESLTFAVLIKEGSFVVPEPDKDYIFVIVMILTAVLAVGLIVFLFVRFMKTREKAHYYKGLFNEPEYQPSKDYSLPEMAEVYLGKKKDMKVAMLLDLVVKKKIEFQKVDDKKWKILVKNLKDVSGDYMDLLSILNGGLAPKEGDEIELKSRTANTTLITLRSTMEKKIVNALKEDELVEEKYHFGDSKKRGVGNVIAMVLIVVPFSISLFAVIAGILESVTGFGGLYGKVYVGVEAFYPVMMGIVTVTTIIATALADAAARYAKHTMKGLTASHYMEGLKLYIGMAEAERMKVLQSVKGADTSAEGIVKLYEKLLPYAAVFGLEESWLKEMKDYCKVEEVKEPDYLMAGIAASDISRSLNRAANIATASTVMSSSGGGSSSGFSGGFGGGFSGGGGGGGGGGGR